MPLLPAIDCTGLPEDGTRPAVINTLAQKLPGTCSNATANAPHGMFWQHVDNGAVQINFWGGAFANGAVIPNTLLSVGIAPVSNRLSYFLPPYN